MKMDETDKPPPTKDSICQSITSRVHSSSNDRSIIGRREVVLLQHLFNPHLASGLRNDLVILAFI